MMPEDVVRRCCHPGCNVTSMQEQGYRVRFGVMLWSCFEHAKPFRDYDLLNKAHEYRSGEEYSKACDGFDKRFNKKYKCKPKISWRDPNIKRHPRYLEWRDESLQFEADWESEYYVNDPYPEAPEYQQSYPIPDETKDYLLERANCELYAMIDLWINQNSMSPDQAFESISQVTKKILDKTLTEKNNLFFSK